MGTTILQIGALYYIYCSQPTIKNNSPSSITELSNLLNNEVSTIQEKAECLEKEGLIQFKLGSKNRKILILNYDKLEIPI
jgi:predicted transcriptional regulator